MPCNPAVVFDIDATLIDEDGGCISSMIEVYNYVKMVGLSPIIVTNRPGYVENVLATEHQLLACGVSGYSLMYFRNPAVMDMWSAKLDAREDIHRIGYTVVASIGDKPWDIGEYGGLGYIVPGEL